MAILVRAYGTKIPDAYAYSLFDPSLHPAALSGKERLFSERGIDEKGRETSFVKWIDKEKDLVSYSRETLYGLDGKKVQEKEYFDESGSEVVHKVSKTASGEREVLEYDGELESTYEREFHPDGSIRREKLLDAEGELVELGEWDEKGLLLLNETPEKTLAFEYEGRVPVRRTEVVEGVETVEEIELEDGRPVRSVVTVDEEESSRKTWTYEGRKVTVDEKDGDYLISRNVEELDEAGRPVYREEIAERDTHVYMRSIWRNEYYPNGLFKQSFLERTILIEGALPKPYRNGFRQATWDDKGRMKELLLGEWREDDFEENSYFRFEYAGE